MAVAAAKASIVLSNLLKALSLTTYKAAKRSTFAGDTTDLPSADTPFGPPLTFCADSSVSKSLCRSCKTLEFYVSAKHRQKSFIPKRKLLESPLTSASCILFSCKTLNRAKPAAVSKRSNILMTFYLFWQISTGSAGLVCARLETLLTAAVSERKS